MKKTQSLKLGQSGSLFNWVYANNATEPKVGEGATVIHYSDRSAYEVLAVSPDGKRVTIQKYDPKRIDSNGMSEDQVYEYIEFEGEPFDIIYRNGGWKMEHTSVVFTDEFYKWIDANPEEFYHNVELRESIWGGEPTLTKVIEGKTQIKKTYPKINIIFGVKREYYDYSF